MPPPPWGAFCQILWPLVWTLTGSRSLSENVIKFARWLYFTIVHCRYAQHACSGVYTLGNTTITVLPWEIPLSLYCHGESHYWKSQYAITVDISMLCQPLQRFAVGVHTSCAASTASSIGDLSRCLRVVQTFFTLLLLLQFFFSFSPILTKLGTHHTCSTCQSTQNCYSRFLKFWFKNFWRIFFQIWT